MIEKTRGASATLEPEVGSPISSEDIMQETFYCRTRKRKFQQ
jgi:hypothetical protein